MKHEDSNLLVLSKNGYIDEIGREEETHLWKEPVEALRFGVYGVEWGVALNACF